MKTQTMKSILTNIKKLENEKKSIEKKIFNSYKELMKSKIEKATASTSIKASKKATRKVAKKATRKVAKKATRKVAKKTTLKSRNFRPSKAGFGMH